MSRKELSAPRFTQGTIAGGRIRHLICLSGQRSSAASCCLHLLCVCM